MNIPKRTITKVGCPHCSNRATMDVLHEYDIDVAEEDSPCSQSDNFQFLKCQSCDNYHLRYYYYDERMNEYEEEPSFQVLYPKPKNKVRHLPPEISRLVEKAEAVKHIDYGFFAIAVGRTLEAVFQSYDVKAKMLDGQIKELKDKGILPDQIAKIAIGIKSFRNLGAHYKEGEVSKTDAEMIHDLVILILEYLYEVPGRIRSLESRSKG
ncbi:MAG TPA: DUF4145 domain-containing protein [Oligoflexus sp.]|nr:DUF4145 domain-containing protein [Oligoflexus sp.]